MKRSSSSVSRRHLLKWSAAIAAMPAGFLIASPTLAQTYPSQDIHFICGFAPGSGADVLVRFFAEKVRVLANRNVIVENKVGALGNIATEYVARAKPDGYTVYLTGPSAIAANYNIMKNPSVDVGKALQIVATINKQPTMIAVRADAPWKTLPELTAALKEKGDRASYAISNPSAKVVGALYLEKAGLTAAEISYRTSADYLNDLASGNIDFAIPDNVFAVTQAKAGRMRILAVSTGERLNAAPDYPTLKELGYDVEVRSWWAALVPSGTPRPIVEQLGKWVSTAVGSDEGKAFLASFASDAWVNGPDEAQAYFLEQIKQWGEYVRIAKIEKQG